ncbi:MAG: peptidylprolyl isomerase [Acidobacteria bacterium]|nr:peptidylprolyl isomerase [Acidobacteriota bacterium]
MRTLRTARRRESSVAVLVLVPVLALVGCSRGEADAAQTAPSAPTAAATSEPRAAASTPAASTVGGATASTAPAATLPAAPGAASADPPLAPEQIPTVVAKIGQIEVTRDDLLSRAAEARGALAERGVQQPPATRSFYRAVLDDIIGNRLLYQDLVARGLTAPKVDVDQRFAEIRGRYASDEEFDRALASRGFDRDRLRSELTEGMTVQRWVQQEVVPSLEVTPEMVQQFYDDNADQMVAAEAVRVSHLLVGVPRGADDATRAASRQKAEALRARIAGGEDFSAVAREASDDRGSAERGGDLGWVQRGQTVPTFEDAAFSLAPGTLSPLVESPFGFHVLEVAEKRPEKKMTVDEARPQIEALLQQRLLEIKVRDAVQELAGKAKIEILL